MTKVFLLFPSYAFDRSKIFALAGLGMSLSFVLTSCQLNMAPVPEAPTIEYIDSAAVVDINESIVTLQAGLPQTTVPEGAVSARFYIGDWESPLVMDSRYEYSRFLFTVQDTCAALPQGDDVSASYEIYDSEGMVLKEDHIKIRIRTCLDQ